MTITTTQKIIKIGASKGVTISPKDLKALKIDVGQQVRLTIEAVDEPDALRDEYEAFKKQYGETLKNLADR